jgi:hypothetical protein
MSGVFTKEKKAQIKSELEDLLKNYSGGPTPEEDNIDEQLAEIAAAPPLDFIEMNTDFYLCKLTHSNTLILLCPTTF